MLGMGRTQGVVAGQNIDFDWNDFDPETYFKHNYVQLRADDRHILEQVRDHFARAFGGKPLLPGSRGIDVGTGPNLYPALTMLPFCDKVTLFEYAQPNIDWLYKEKEGNWPSWTSAWRQFWEVLCEREVYAASFVDPQTELAKRAVIKAGSVYGLEEIAQYNVGTMFFVAESITEQESEFRSAVDHFLDALAPGAPFAIAFMEHSEGYHVADHHFPATDIDENTVSSCLRNRVEEISIEHIDTGDKPLRDGYSGMLLALGRVNGLANDEKEH